MDLDKTWIREQDIAAEQAVLGSMVIDPKNTAPMVLSVMEQSDFQSEMNRRIFLAARDLARSVPPQPVDIVLILQKLGGGSDVRQYLLMLMDTTPTACNVKEYMELVKTGAKLAKIRQLSAQMAAVLDPTEALTYTRQINDLLATDEQGYQDQMDMAEAYSRYIDRDDPKHKDGLWVLKWKYDFLNQSLRIRPKDMVLVAGRPSDGKTAWCVDQAFELSKEHNVLFVTLEDDKDQIYERVLAAQSKVSLSKIIDHDMDESEWELVAETATEGAEKHRLTIADGTGYTVERLEAKIMVNHAEIVFVDYIQLMKASIKGRATRTDEVADISRQMRELAKRQQVVLVCLCQLGRPLDKNGKRREPVPSDLKESGQLEQDAKAILAIWRQEETSSSAPRYLSVIKNKTGPLGTYYLSFNGDTQHFYPEYSGAMTDREDE